MMVAKLGRVIIDLEKEGITIDGFTFNCGGEGPEAIGEYIHNIILNKAKEIIDKEQYNFMKEE